MKSQLLILSLSASHALVKATDTSNNEDKRSLSSTLENNLIQSLETVKAGIDSNLLLYQTPASQWEQSTIYRYDDMLESIKIMSTEGVAGKKFYVGEEVENGHVYGLVNIAAFLAQSMKETIQYDACDENSWDLINGRYPLSNACGQLGQSYQDYSCSEEEKHMECPVDPSMSITAVTHAKWYGAPGPMFCGPKTQEQPFSGFWDHTYECNKSWANPPENCEVYEGQKAGRYDQTVAVANTAGRTDVEGCCWWGRGVIQTSGVCNFGKLNWFLGAGAANDGRASRYPNIDFCKDPEIICSSTEYKELKWIAGMFYWIESVQGYQDDEWDYLTELRTFVESGMTGNNFIDAVSGIVNRGCHNPPCATGPVDGAHERSQNFNKVLDTFFQGSRPVVSSQQAHPAQAVLPPVAFTPEVDPNYGSTGSYPVVSQPQVTPNLPVSSDPITSSSSSESHGAVIDYPVSLSNEPSKSPLSSYGSAENHPNIAQTPGTPFAHASSHLTNTNIPEPEASIDYPVTFTDKPSTSPISFQGQTEASTSLNTSDESYLGSHDSQIPKSMLVYSCRDDADPRLNSLSVDIPFQYEAVISSAINPGDATQEIKGKIMQDIGGSLGCNVSSKRHLRQTTEIGAISGFQSNIDLSDGNTVLASCGDLSEDPMQLCISVTSSLTVFIDQRAPADIVEGSKDLIRSLIEDGMKSGKYTSDNVKHVILSQETLNGHQINQSDNIPISIQSSEVSGTVANDGTSSANPVWIPLVATLIILLVVAVNIIFYQRYQQNKSANRVQSDPKTLASFVSNLEGIPTPRMDSTHSNSSESVEESHLDCFDELNGPPFGINQRDEPSVSDHFSRESNSDSEHFSRQSTSESNLVEKECSDDKIVLFVDSDHSSLSNTKLDKE